jgi:hypothetical protein
MLCITVYVSVLVLSEFIAPFVALAISLCGTRVCNGTSRVEADVLKLCVCVEVIERTMLSF